MRFLVALVAAMSIGVWAAGPISDLACVRWIKPLVVAAVMFASGVTMPSGSVRRTIGSRAAWVASVVNLFGVPAIMGLWFSFAWTTSDWALRGGLWIVTFVPCTLASAAVWTRRAGGNDAIAMATTLVTNVACLVTAPLFCQWLMATSGGTMPPMAIATKLGLTVVAPLVIAHEVRRWTGGEWFDRRRAAIGFFNQAGILVMVVLGSAAGTVAGNAKGASFPNALNLIGMTVTVAVVHLAALAIGIAAAWRMVRADQIAVGLAGSQKTLLVGLQMAMTAGVSVVPMLAYHMVQLMIDTVVADLWRRRFGGD